MIMAAIVLFFAGTLLIGIELKSDNEHFFDKQNSNAMRGFWCLTVILVHVPIAYQNRIQDMLGSFAYIGVTFFFMTSAYGLKLEIEKKPGNIKTFWRRRLPKLLIPCIFVNIVGIMIDIVKGKEISAISLIYIDCWVRWLLVCYLIFWIAQRFCAECANIIICVLVIFFSITVYVCKGWINQTTWCPEVFGFVWGILFKRTKDEFTNWINRAWGMKCAMLFVIVGLLGVAYLKLKPVVFFGDYLLKTLLGLAIITFMLALNSHIKLGNRVNQFLGGISFEVYLLHGIVFGLIIYLMAETSSGVFIVSGILVTIVLSVIVHKVNRLCLKG